MVIMNKCASNRIFRYSILILSMFKNIIYQILEISSKFMPLSTTTNELGPQGDIPERAITAARFTEIVTVVIIYLQQSSKYLWEEARNGKYVHLLMCDGKRIYNILRPLSIKRLFFLACLCISAASESSFSDVEVRKLEAWELIVSLDAPKLYLMSFIAPVVLYMVSVASFAVSMIMFTTVFAREWNFAFPPRTNPDAVLQIVFPLSKSCRIYIILAS